jgi:hypothetical protein
MERTMTVKYGDHACEHCGVKVPLARLCPSCGNEHSADWIYSNQMFGPKVMFWMIMLTAVSTFLLELDFFWSIAIVTFSTTIFCIVYFFFLGLTYEKDMEKAREFLQLERKVGTQNSKLV